MTRRFLTTAVAATAAFLIASTAFAAPPAMSGTAAIGAVLTDSKGMTLYTFDKDTATTSACVDACAKNWPALTAAAGSANEGNYTIIKRADGSSQWAYKGKPLYLWSKDMKPGDTTGDGFKDVWHAARP